MRLVPLQFKLRWLFVAVAIVVLVASLMFDTLWVGYASIPMEFFVLDASSEHPIYRASIRLIDGAPEYEATTGPDGKAGIVIHAMIAGRKSLLHRSRSVNYGFWRVAVWAKGYKRLTHDLDQFTRDSRFHTGTIPPAIVLRLQPETSIP